MTTFLFALAVASVVHIVRRTRPDFIANHPNTMCIATGACLVIGIFVL